MKKYILFFVFGIITYSSYAQIGIGTHTPDGSSALDVRLPNKGVLLSRVALTGTTDVTTIPLAANALTVYNTATTSDVTPGYYYWNANKWVRILDSDSPSISWSLTGNNVKPTDFIGTTNDVDLVFKSNNKQAGLIKPFSTAFGSEALLAMTGDNYNTAFGAETLKANTTGMVNVAIGTYALASNSTGEGNNAIGAGALYVNTKGNFNIAIGSNTLMANTEGSKNIGIGTNALVTNITGKDNVAIGNNSLKNFTTGNGNSVLGTDVGTSFTLINSGSNNTFIGYKTADGISRGNANTIIGANVDIRANRIGAAIPLSNNIIIADGDGNQRININDKGNVGLGTNTPHEAAALDITSSNKGLLLPRVALTATNAIAPLSAVTAGMTVYNTATAGVTPNNVTPGQYYHNGSQWVRLVDVSPVASSGWSTTGNPAKLTDFIGTTNNVDLVFKRNNIPVGKLGSSVISLGIHSLTNNSTGLNNVAIGDNALSNNSAGSRNNATGTYALLSNTTGNDNIATGYSALNGNTTGSNNIATGFQALYSNTTGASNFATGFNALFYNKTGSFNIATGHEALQSNIEGAFNIATGYNALRANTIGGNNIAIGTQALFDNQGGSNNIALGAKALRYNYSGDNNIAIGNDSGMMANNSSMLTNTTAIGYGAKVSASNEIRLGNYTIGKLSAQVALTVASDKRYKENIKTMPLGLDFINKIRPVEYIRKNNELKTKEWGVIAQELQQTLQTVNYNDAGLVQEDGSEDKMLSVRYTDLIAPMIKGMQELSEQNNKLEEENKQQKDKIEQLQLELKEIKTWIEEIKQSDS
ncbi:tail fiber domain-containing protein [Flavobacterium sp. ALJ2]|uniref:tail fiber domain-containing protein n=1 Tax=Flavobacterium sp. ALJ2 TaxID=2786960 RepID=UPI00189F8336|nr:tail fiber domain-containing protein [Flavobacterium sp. ALJ2]MBF7093299.1 tail fiber domain-containing protein [Flavobacterium sp. ALJ2]